MADTSQSSFESGGSPSQRLLAEEYQRESAMIHSSQGTSVDAYSSSPTPGMVRHPLRRADLHRLRGHASHRHPLMTEGMMASSLPTKYEEEEFNTRPSFRKSASQPTRSMSPALSLRSPTEPPGHSSSMVFSAAAHAQAAWTSKAAFYSKKRQLPQVPLTGRSSRDQLNFPPPQVFPSAIPFDPSKQQQRHTYRSHFTRTSSGDSMTPQGMYSDSEITARPSYSTDKLFYAHPTHRPMSGSHHRDRRSKSSVSRSIYSPETESRGVIGVIDTEGLDDHHSSSTIRKSREDVRRESVEFIPRRSRIREKTRFDSEREKGVDEGSETSSRISVTEAASAAGSAGSSTRTAVSSAKTQPVKSTTPAATARYFILFTYSFYSSLLLILSFYSILSLLLVFQRVKCFISKCSCNRRQVSCFLKSSS